MVRAGLACIQPIHLGGWASVIMTGQDRTKIDGEIKMATLALAIFGAVIAAIATAATAWQGLILRKQLENDMAVRTASFHQDVAKLLIELDRTFMEHPELRPYFYDNQVPENSAVEQQTMALAEYIVDLVECYVTAEDVCPELTGDWDDYFNYLHRNSHSLRKYWEDFGHLYPPRVARAIVGPSARPKQWPRHRKHEIVSADQQHQPTSSDHNPLTS